MVQSIGSSITTQCIYSSQRCGYINGMHIFMSHRIKLLEAKLYFVNLQEYFPHQFCDLILSKFYFVYEVY